MQAPEQMLIRTTVALALAGLAGLLLSKAGATVGAVVLNSTIFAAAIIFCGSVVSGKMALWKVSAVLCVLMGILAGIGYALTLAIDGVGSWTSAWLMDICLAVIIVLSPSVLGKLNLRRSA